MERIQVWKHDTILFPCSILAVCAKGPREDGSLPGLGLSRPVRRRFRRIVLRGSRSKASVHQMSSLAVLAHACFDASTPAFFKGERIAKLHVGSRRLFLIRPRRTQQPLQFLCSRAENCNFRAIAAGFRHELANSNLSRGRTVARFVSLCKRVVQRDLKRRPCDFQIRALRLHPIKLRPHVEH